MVLQSSGPISIGDVKNEFGPSKGYSNSLAYYRDVVLGRYSGPVSLSEFYGRYARIEFKIWIDTADWESPPGGLDPEGWSHWLTPWGYFFFAVSNNTDHVFMGASLGPILDIAWSPQGYGNTYSREPYNHWLGWAIPHMGWSATATQPAGPSQTPYVVQGPLYATPPPHTEFWIWAAPQAIPPGWMYFYFE